ncbi:MAG: FAD-dependent thymidylate synthase, partial [Polyangiaceae bacterium]
MTKRPTSPGAEELLGLYFPVLDHGFVSLVDYMGTDDCIERAARVSYGYGTRKTSQTRGLILYLRRHAHKPPSEMVEFKFHCCMPMFVARQWIRHRSACLAGDAQLWFDLPGAEKRGARQRHSMTISKLHRLWHEGTTHPIVKKKPLYLERIDVSRHYTIPELARLVERREETLRNCVRDGSLQGARIAQSDPRRPSILVAGQAWHDFAVRTHEARVSMKDRLKRMQLRSLDESTGEIIKTNVVDVWESGTKPVFRVTLENGYTLGMSKDHRCFTERGWMTLEEATSLRLGPTGAVTWDASSPAFATNGQPAYRDQEWRRTKRSEGLSVAQIAEQAGTSYHNIRKYLKTFGLTFSMQEKHKLVHADHLELQRTEAVSSRMSLKAFFDDKERQPQPSAKKARRTTRIVRTFS